MKPVKANRFDHSFEPSEDWRHRRYWSDLVWFLDTYRIMEFSAGKKQRKLS